MPGNRQNMADAIEVDCEVAEEDKPLLPKWFVWTWPGSPFFWGFWGLGALSVGYGLTSSLIQMDVGGFPLAAIGFLIMGFATPNPFAQIMDEFSDGFSEHWSHSPMPPMSRKGWHIDRLEWNEKIQKLIPDPLSKFEHDGPLIEIREKKDKWVVFQDGKEMSSHPTGKEADVAMKELIKKGDKLNAQEMLFGNHPRHHRFRKLYNASPPIFTTRFFHHAFAVIFMAGLFLGMGIETREASAKIAMWFVISGAIWVTVSHFSYRNVSEAWDTVTSIIKFMDGGHNEIVGQVRPLNSFPLPTVHVDGCRNPDWTFDDLVAWGWAYRATEQWTERVYNSQTKRWETKTRRQTRWVRGDHDRSDFLLHDGTGGVIVKLDTFENVNLGNTIWSRHQHGGNGCGPLEGPIHGGRMVEHVWTLSALKLGDPAYLMARVKSLPHDQVPRGMVAENASRVHQTLQVVGEDAPRRIARINKGTEFSVLKAKKSFSARLGPAILLIASGMLIYAI